MDVLNQLREANKERCPLFGNGEIGDWSEERWALAIAGETGEMCNLVKKSIRGDKVDPELIGKEIADIVIYADMLAQKLGFTLSDLIVRKFNETSKRFADQDPPTIARQYPEFDQRFGKLHYIRYGVQIEGQWFSVKVLREGGYIRPKLKNPTEVRGPFESGMECDDFTEKCNSYFKKVFGWNDSEIQSLLEESFRNGTKE